MILGRVICALPKLLGGGHRRGKLLGVGPEFTSDGDYINMRTIACPRCGRKTRYKLKPKPAHSQGEPSDGSARYSVQEAI